jgi:hypothetical protein
MKVDEPFAPGRTLQCEVVGTKVSPEVAKAQEPYKGKRFEITIDRMEPERLFSWRWHPGEIDPKRDYSKDPTTLVVFTLEEAEGGTPHALRGQHAVRSGGRSVSDPFPSRRSAPAVRRRTRRDPAFRNEER